MRKRLTLLFGFFMFLLASVWSIELSKLMRNDGAAIEASTVVFESKSPKTVCQDVSSGKIKIGVQSFYNNNDTILSPTKGTCSNTKEFKNTLGSVGANDDYPSWVTFARSDASLKHSVEGVDVTDADKYRYLYVANRNQAFDANGKLSQVATLKAGENTFIDIDLSDANLKTNDYKDIRVNMNYMYSYGDIDISLYGSITFYVIDENGNQYGPFKMGDAELKNRVRYYNDKSEKDYDEYRLVSENISSSNTSVKIPGNTKIKTIRIVPYENYPIQVGYLRIISFSVEAYHGNYNGGKQYVDVANAANQLRQNITNNMATNATIKWGVAPGRNLSFYCILCKKLPLVFSNGETYYGQPYVNVLNSTTSSFFAQTNSEGQYEFATTYLNDEQSSRGNIMKKGTTTTNPLYVYEPGSYDTLPVKKEELMQHDYVSNKESQYFLGQDCSSSTFYAIGEELPYSNSLAGASRYITNGQVEILGGIKMDVSEIEKLLRNNGALGRKDRFTSSILEKSYSSYVKAKYNEQAVFNGYGLLEPGDAVVKAGHVRLETGYPHIECGDGTVTERYSNGYCNSHNGINGDKSYIIITEVAGVYRNMYETTNERNTHVTQKEAGWTMVPDSRYTDVTNVDELYSAGNTKKTSFKINKKYTFSDLYGDKSSASGSDTISIDEDSVMYLPFRYKVLANTTNTGKVEKPKAKLVFGDDKTGEDNNAKLYEFVKNNNKLRGLITTNYMIDRVKVEINNAAYYIAPNQTNIFSLYYGIKDEAILTALKKLNYNGKNTIKVSIDMGPHIGTVRKSTGVDNEGFMEVLTIKTPEEPVEPVTPVTPGEPVEPVEPEEPVLPEEPTETVMPEEPEDPIEPEEPIMPVTPEEPEAPILPAEPEEPTEIVTPTEPIVTPTAPGQIGEITDEPEYTIIPEEPAKPEEPTASEESTTGFGGQTTTDKPTTPSGQAAKDELSSPQTGFMNNQINGVSDEVFGMAMAIVTVFLVAGIVVTLRFGFTENK